MSYFLKLSSSESLADQFRDLHDGLVESPEGAALLTLDEDDDASLVSREGISFSTISAALFDHILSFVDSKAGDDVSILLRLRRVCWRLRRRLNHGDIGLEGVFTLPCYMSPPGRFLFVQKVLLPDPGANLNRVRILAGAFPFLREALVQVSTSSDAKNLLVGLQYFPASFRKLDVNVERPGRIGTSVLVRALCCKSSLRTLFISGIDFFSGDRGAGVKLINRIGGTDTSRGGITSLVERLKLHIQPTNANVHVFHVGEEIDLQEIFQNPFVKAIKREVRVRIFRKKAVNLTNSFQSLIRNLRHLRLFDFDGGDEDNFAIDFGRVRGSANLRELILRGCTLTHPDFPPQLFPNMEVLRIEECKFLEFRRSRPAFASTLFPSFREFSFSDNSSIFDDFVVTRHSFPNLEKLKLTSNDIPGSSIAHHWPTSQHLKSIDFSYNALTGDAYYQLLVSSKVLERLCLESNPIDFSRGADFHESLFLRELNLSRATVGYEGLLTVLKDFPRLGLLSVSRTGILFDPEIGNEIPMSPYLHTVDICGNKLGEAGFIQFMLKMPSLRRFCASSCDISITQLFTDAVSEYFFPLVDVSLSLNYISTDGFQAFLRVTPELSYCDFVSNRISAPRFPFEQHDHLRVILLALNSIEVNDVPHVFRHCPMVRMVMVGHSKDGIANLYYPILKNPT